MRIEPPWVPSCMIWSWEVGWRWELGVRVTAYDDGATGSQDARNFAARVIGQAHLTPMGCMGRIYSGQKLCLLKWTPPPRTFNIYISATTQPILTKFSGLLASVSQVTTSDTMLCIPYSLKDRLTFSLKHMLLFRYYLNFKFRIQCDSMGNHIQSVVHPLSFLDLTLFGAAPVSEGLAEGGVTQEATDWLVAGYIPWQWVVAAPTIISKSRSCANWVVDMIFPSTYSGVGNFHVHPRLHPRSVVFQPLHTWSDDIEQTKLQELPAWLPACVSVCLSVCYTFLSSLNSTNVLFNNFAPRPIAL